MQLTVKGKHLDVGDALREHVRQNLTQTAEKYFSNPIEATVVFSKEKDHLFKVDISIHVGKDMVLHSQHQANDPYPAFDTASARVAKRLRRYKDRLRDHHQMPAREAAFLATYKAFQSSDMEEKGDDGDEPAVVAELELPVQTLTVSEAVMKLELADLPAMMFKNAAHDGLNMVYRRKDGNIGWVDPQGNPQK